MSNQPQCLPPGALTDSEITLLDELNVMAKEISVKIILGTATEHDLREGQRLTAVAKRMLESAKGRMN